MPIVKKKAAEKPAAKKPVAKKPTVKKEKAPPAPPSAHRGDAKVILTVEGKAYEISPQDAQQLWRELGHLVVTF